MTIDQFAYKLKQHCGPLFKVAEVICGYGVAFLHGKRIREALDQAEQSGTIRGNAARIRALVPGDIYALLAFYETLPEGHFKYFRPHGFARRDVEKVLARPYYLAYGLFLEGELVGYSLFKLYPGKKAFFGRMLSTKLTGCGLGKYLSLYLQWQSRIMGFKMRGTINLQNSPSVASHQAVGGFEILGDLPNGYTLIEFPADLMPTEPPVLDVRLE
ncbi:MAG: GNAT family N-acetyltransferase [Verrucomicrobia bacterium]|nr:GNAT family N-acetyltransferase [Verrucomicrobiota bacterium]